MGSPQKYSGSLTRTLDIREGIWVGSGAGKFSLKADVAAKTIIMVRIGIILILNPFDRETSNFRC